MTAVAPPAALVPSTPAVASHHEIAERTQFGPHSLRVTPNARTTQNHIRSAKNHTNPPPDYVKPRPGHTMSPLLLLAGEGAVGIEGPHGTEGRESSGLPGRV